VLVILPRMPRNSREHVGELSLSNHDSECGRGDSTRNSHCASRSWAASLTVYLGALGITAAVEMVATWLNLVPVIAMELGSALAGVLVASFKG